MVRRRREHFKGPMFTVSVLIDGDSYKRMSQLMTDKGLSRSQALRLMVSEGGKVLEARIEVEVAKRIKELGGMSEGLATLGGRLVPAQDVAKSP